MSQTPAGWYVDAQGVTRWWDGTQWTEHTQPSGPEAGAADQVAQQPVAEPDPERTRIRETPRAEGQGAEGQGAEGQGAGAPWQQQAQQPPAQAGSQASPWGGGPAAQPQDPAWGGGAPGAVPPPPPVGPPGAQGGQWGGPAGPNQYAGWGAQPDEHRSRGVKPWMLIVAGAVVVAVIVVVVLVVVLGGDDEPANNASDSPTNASASAFCDSFDLTKFDPSMSKSDLESIQDKMRDVGTPSDMPSEARKGWEWFVNVSNASEAKDIDESQLTALGQYYATTCAGQ